jgi:Flp pilus assembly protein TadG
MSVRGHRPRRGQALVEFALVIPWFALLLFGLIDLGRFVYVSNALNESAREAARVGSVSGFTQDCPGVSSRTQCIAQIALGRMVAVPGTTVTSTCQNQTGNGTVTVTADQCQSGAMLTVTLRTPFSMFTPIIGQLVGTATLTGQATVTVNN